MLIERLYTTEIPGDEVGRFFNAAPPWEEWGKHHYGSYDNSSGKKVHTFGTTVDQYRGTPLGELVAGASVEYTFLRDTSAWELRAIMVAEPYRHLGIGRMLLERMQQSLAAACGIDIMVCKAPEGVVGFFRKVGWVFDNKYCLPRNDGRTLMLKRIRR